MYNFVTSRNTRQFYLNFGLWFSLHKQNGQLCVRVQMTWMRTLQFTCLTRRWTPQEIVCKHVTVEPARVQCCPCKQLLSRRQAVTPKPAATQQKQPVLRMHSIHLPHNYLPSKVDYSETDGKTVAAMDANCSGQYCESLSLMTIGMKPHTRLWDTHKFKGWFAILAYDSCMSNESRFRSPNYVWSLHHFLKGRRPVILSCGCIDVTRYLFVYIVKQLIGRKYPTNIVFNF